MNNNLINISINDAIKQLQSKINDVYPHALKSGLNVIDVFTGGFMPGELVVIGARPAMGKSVFTFNIMSYMLWKKIPVALFSATDFLNVNFMARLIGVIKNAEIGYMYEKKVDMINNANLEDIPLYINLDHRMTLPFIKEQALQLKKEKGIKCLFIETIQTLFDAHENGYTKEGMEKVCRELKILAQELEIPIIVTSELNRSPEYREGVEGKCPQLCDLRSSGAIESNADKILLLHRPEYYHIFMDENGVDLRGIMTVNIAKNKYGALGDCRVRFNALKCQITDIDGSLREKEENENSAIQLLKDSTPFRDLKEKLGLEIQSTDSNCPF